MCWKMLKVVKHLIHEIQLFIDSPFPPQPRLARREKYEFNLVEEFS